VIPTTPEHVEAALKRTRLSRKMRNAVTYVLVDNLSVIEAGRRTRRHRNNVYRALAVVRRQIRKVKRNHG
jgi:DNA-directed RNA polymerase specialized sigma24 family protein